MSFLVGVQVGGGGGREEDVGVSGGEESRGFVVALVRSFPLRSWLPGGD